jgi:hypothetical protein
MIFLRLFRIADLGAVPHFSGLWSQACEIPKGLPNDTPGSTRQAYGHIRKERSHSESYECLEPVPSEILIIRPTVRI